MKASKNICEKCFNDLMDVNKQISVKPIQMCPIISDMIKRKVEGDVVLFEIDEHFHNFCPFYTEQVVSQ